MRRGMIDKIFDPAGFEQTIYARWERDGAFRPARPDAPPFTAEFTGFTVVSGRL